MFDVLIVTAPCGGGKTTIAFEASEVLQEVGVAHGVIDLDALTWCYPASDGDPYRTALGFRNLGHLGREFAAAGARRLIIARVVESRDELDDHYEPALPGSTFTVARLRSSDDTLERRLRDRERGAALQSHLDRAHELSGQMERDQVQDFVIDNDGRSVREVALDLLVRVGWIEDPAPANKR